MLYPARFSGHIENIDKEDNIYLLYMIYIIRYIIYMEEEKEIFGNWLM